MRSYKNRSKFRSRKNKSRNKKRNKSKRKREKKYSGGYKPNNCHDLSSVMGGFQNPFRETVFVTRLSPP